MNEVVNKLLTEWLTATDVHNAKNKLGEKIAELCAHAKLEEIYGTKLKAALIIPRRGKEGTIILDIVYEMQDGDIIIAESKFNLSKRGKVNQVIYGADDEIGAALRMTVEDAVTQLEGQWVKDRIDEIGKKNSRLAIKMRSAWDNFKLKVVEIRTIPEVNGGKATISEIIVTDETENVNNFKRKIPTPLTPQQKEAKSIARKLARERAPAEHAERIAKDARLQAKKVTDKAQTLRAKADAAKREANLLVREPEKTRKSNIAKEADTAAVKAEAEAAKANQKALEAEQEYQKLAIAVQNVDKKALRKAITEAKEKAKALRTKANAAAKKAERAKFDIERQQKSLAEAKRSDAIRNRTRKVEEAEEFARKAKQEALEAEELALKAELEYKHLSNVDPRGTLSTATDATAVEARINSSPKATYNTNASAIIEDVSLKEARAIGDQGTGSTVKNATVVDNRGLDKTGIKTKAEIAAEEVEEASAKLLKKVSELSAKARKPGFVIEYTFKAGRLLGKAGRFVFTFMQVTGLNLLGDILFLIDAIDYFISFYKRKEIEERKEWTRVIDFLFGEPRVIMSVFGVPYSTSVRDNIIGMAQFNLGNGEYPKNFLFWLNKWNSERNWEGFVYIQVHFLAERQQRQESDNDIPYNTKYYWGGYSEVDLVAVPKKNQLSKIPIGLANEGSEDNYSSMGRGKGSYTPEYNYVVEISKLEILFTQPIPCLTPFDFIIVKCRILYSAIISFLSKYDPMIIDGIDDLIDEEFVDKYLGQDLFKNYPFPSHLNAHLIRKSTMTIFWAIKYLSQHNLKEEDYEMGKHNVTYNKGLFRRQQLLFNLVRPGRDYNGMSMFYYLATQLLNLVNGNSNKNLLIPVNPDLADLTEKYLSKLASDIDNDLKRALEDTKKRPYAYQYKGVENSK